eukprot:CAMPEP_0172589914 /NCGR_PEP_ID=MMETSP1068-20121228/8450_1 /TAXON_ID=35684 /ORGANISM="Pseudopedinella elastica, Strain CCMP716" /LENGTH=166 /DNA_ID=CAMNT_0013385585 /DNA_START=529 /DNA_END=1026 /DNA_ORIENTATION=+
MFKPNPLSSMVPHSKIYLDLDGDISLTALDLKEDINWWWVDFIFNVLSMAYFEDKARGDARKAEAGAARTAEEPQPEPAPLFTSMANKRAGIFGKLYEKIPGNLKGGIGHYYNCTDASCEKHEHPYFVGPDESSLNVTSFFVFLIHLRNSLMVVKRRSMRSFLIVL